MRESKIPELFGEERKKALGLLKNIDDLTAMCCFEDFPHSRLYVDDAERPRSAMCFAGGYREGSCAFAFTAGDHSLEAAKAIVAAWPRDYLGSRIIVPENEGWCAVIEEALPDASRFNRYAISKTEHRFDRAALARMAENVPEGFELRPMDGDIFERLCAEEWSYDMVASYDDYDSFSKTALGWICLEKGVPVGGASSFASYSKGIEIEIDTKREYRRRGIARACASRLILECLDKGLYPSWDAANRESLALAESLGYVFSHEYPAYFVETTVSSENRD